MNREIQTATPKSSRLSAFLLLIIFLAMLIAAWQWADKQGHIVNIQRSLAEYLTNVDFFGKRPRQLMAEVQTTKEETKRQLSRLRADTEFSQDQQEIAEKLSELADKIDALPLAMDAHLAEVEFPLKQLAASQDNRWCKFINDIWQDLQQFVKVQRIDNPEIELLSPSQRDLLREKIKLRLLLAQFSLLTHDQTDYQANLEKAISLIDRHYDKQTESVINVLNELDQLHSYTIDKAVPNISQRLDTARNIYRLKRNEEGE